MRNNEDEGAQNVVRPLNSKQRARPPISRARRLILKIRVTFMIDVYIASWHEIGESHKRVRTTVGDCAGF